VPLGSFVRENLVVIATLKSLIAEEVNLIEILLLDELEAIRFVPSIRKDVEGNLPPDAESQVEIGKLFLHGCHHILPNIVREVKLLVVIPLFAGAVPSNGGNVHHATTELNKSATLRHAR